MTLKIFYCYLRPRTDWYNLYISSTKKTYTCYSDKYGIQKCQANGCLLMRVTNNGNVFLCIYVENMIVVGDKVAVEKIKQEIKKLFNTKEAGTIEKNT